MMLRRNGQTLAFTSTTLCLVALAGVPAAILLLGELPEEHDIEWAYPWARGSALPSDGERVARVETAATELERAMSARLLASPASMTELREAHAAFTASTSPITGPSSPEQRVALTIHAVRNSAQGTPVVASLLFVVVGLSGLLSFLRLRRFRAVTLVTCSLLAVGAAGGVGALAVLDVSPAWVATPTLLGILGLFGVMLGTNLLPDSNHPLVVAAEKRLRELPARRRRAHVAIRVVSGLVVSGVAVIGTVVSYALTVPGAFYTAYVGAFALGLIAATVPLIAAIRLAAEGPQPEPPVSASFEGAP